MVEGTLRYNPDEDRVGIWTDDGWYIDGLHCGMCFDVRPVDDGEWIPTRIEYGTWAHGEGWYLVGITAQLEGLPCRWHEGW